MEIWILADDDDFIETTCLCIKEFNPIIKIFGSMFEVQDLIAENPEFNIPSPDFIFIDLGGILGLAGMYGVGHSESIEIYMVKGLMKHFPTSVVFIYSSTKINAVELTKKLDNLAIYMDINKKMPDEWIKEIVFNQEKREKYD